MNFLKTLGNRSLQSLTFNWIRSYAAVPSTAALGKKAIKKGGKLGQVAEKKVLPIETDPMKLVNFVCGSNINVKGEDVKIKPDSEYPEWLWTLHVGPPKKLYELDPETKAYWRKLRQIGCRRNNQLIKIRKLG